MVTRGRVRLLAVLGGVVLLAGPRIAPLVPPVWIVPVSAVWLAALATLLVLAARVLAEWIGRAAGPALLAAVVATGLVVTGYDWSGAAGTRMPCRRNWGWLPAWLLRSSPLESVTFQAGQRRLKLCYGSPAARGRRMIGGPPVPFGALWRTGANEPTTLRASGPIAVAGIPVREGRASLYTVPGPATWEIVVNGSTSQWGIERLYTGSVEAREIGRAVVAADSTPRPLERLEFAAQPMAGDTVALVLRWERTSIRIPVWPID